MPPKIRRSHAERSAETRARLMQATLECLQEVGYGGTTIRLVEERSGVSRGAIFNQFPTRADLLIAAVQHIAHLTMEKMRVESTAVGANEGVDGLIDLMCRQFEGPLFYTSLELWNAARTDAHLAEALYLEERKLGGYVREIVSGMFGIDPEGRAAVTGIALTWQFMRGAALTAILKHDAADQERLIAEWRALIAPMFAAEATFP